MNKLTINTQSRNELNAATILAAFTWSLTMIFSDEIIASNRSHVFSLIPLLPVMVFCSALLRHLKRVASNAAKVAGQNMAVVLLLTSAFAIVYSQVDGVRFAQISALAIYSFFSISLVAISVLRNSRKV